MILQPARIVLIDDNEQHLVALSRALAEMGSACLPFHYRDEHPDPQQLAGARVIFCDLQLGSDALTSDKTVFHANIASMLAAGISAQHGPYMLIVWSQYGEELDRLKEYMQELAPGQRPFAVVPLDKNEFIDTGTGQIREDANLAVAVKQVLESQPGLAAMLDWEEVVARGAWRTTSTLWDSCLAVEASDPDTVLRNTLGQLARGAAGQNASNHPGYSVREALSPLLDDQIGMDAMDEDRWSNAVLTDAGEHAAKSSQLYTALHFEIPSFLPSSSRGVASKLPSAWSAEEEFVAKFGFSKNDVLKMTGFGGDRLECAATGASWFLVQISAACDDGSGAPRYLPYCLAVAVPTMRVQAGNTVPLKAQNKPKGSVEQTREVLLWNGEPECLYLFGSFVLGLVTSETVDFEPKFRIRRSLLDKLIMDIRFNSARLGVVEP